MSDDPSYQLKCGMVTTKGVRSPWGLSSYTVVDYYRYLGGSLKDKIIFSPGLFLLDKGGSQLGEVEQMQCYLRA